MSSASPRTGELDPHPDASLEFSGDALSGTFERPKHFGLRLLPLNQQVPAAFPVFCFHAAQRRLLLLEGSQLFNPTAEPDKLLAIDSGFLELSKLLFVRGNVRS